jgi:hypothetical protein
MVIPGRFHKGVVILEGGPLPPEGAAVTVSYTTPAGKHRFQVPFIPSEQPSSVDLTNARIAQIMDEEDAAARH